MKTILIATLAAAGLGLSLAACAPAEKAADATKTPPEKRVALPDCATVKTEDKGADGWKHPDCRLIFPDQSGLSVDVRYAPAEDDSTKVTLQVFAAGDAPQQKFEERMGNTFEGPRLEDFDKDSKLDIIAPLETGNVNTDWAIYRQAGTGGKSFVRIGEVSGVEFAKTADGYFSVQGRSSANESYVGFYKLDGDTLKLMTTADVTAQGEPDKITGVECVLDQEGADLKLTGLDEKAAQAKFCAEPVVVALYK